MGSCPFSFMYSNSKKKWFQGEVAQIFTDEEGEWLEVRNKYHYIILHYIYHWISDSNSFKNNTFYTI